MISTEITNEHAKQLDHYEAEATFFSYEIPPVKIDDVITRVTDDTKWLVVNIFPEEPIVLLTLVKKTTLKMGKL